MPPEDETMRRRRRHDIRRSILDNLDTAPATVAQPHAPTAADEQIGEDLDFDWKPRPLERAVETDRSFRWPIIGAALLMAVGAIVVVRGLGTFSDTQAQERLATYRAAVTEFEDALDDLQSALPDIGVAEALAFDTATETLREVAEEDLPGLPPFVPQGSLGDVQRAQEHLIEMADAAALVSSDLDLAASFTEASARLFAVPPLPFSAPEELIDPAGEAITTMQSETRATLASLEPVDTFAGYLAAVEAALADLPDWTDRYLLALRRGDAETAELLIGSIRSEAETVDGELTIGLTAIARGVEERIADIRAAIDRAKVLTSSG
jgi:hypothetical protein